MRKGRNVVPWPPSHLTGDYSRGRPSRFSPEGEMPDANITNLCGPCYYWHSRWSIRSEPT